MQLIINRLNYYYNQNTVYEKKALDNIELVIKENEFIGIIGHTGSGKSTLIQHFNGLIKATSGNIYYKGQDIYDKDYQLKNLRKKVGLVFQYPEHQLFEETVFKDICFGIKDMGLSKDEIEDRVYDVLQKVGLSIDILDVSPFELSGGQKRRVAIAGILIMQPEVLILDEPTAGLDPKGREDILGQINMLRNTKGMTIILVSHSMEDVAKYVDRLVVMDKGKIIFDNTPNNIFQYISELEEIGLSAPAVTYLMQELKRRGLPVNTDVITVEDAKKEIMKIFRSKK